MESVTDESCSLPEPETDEVGRAKPGDEPLPTSKEDRVKINVGGTPIEIDKHILLLSGSPVLTNLIGEGKFKPYEKGDDGRPFLDCNPNDFWFVIGYVRTGHWAHSGFNVSYIKKICDQLGVNFTPRKKLTSPEKRAKNQKMHEKRENFEKEYLLSHIQKLVDTYTHIKIEVHHAYRSECTKCEVKGNVIAFLANDICYNYVRMLRASKMMTDLFFSSLKKEGYRMTVTKTRNISTSTEFTLRFDPISEKDRCVHSYTETNGVFTCSKCGADADTYTDSDDDA